MGDLSANVEQHAKQVGLLDFLLIAGIVHSVIIGGIKHPR